MNKVLFISMSVIAVTAVTVTAAGEVDLVLRPVGQNVDPGDVVTLELLAVSRSPGGTSIAAIDAAITWNRERLELAGVEDDGLHPWLIAGLLPDPDGVNGDLADGDVVYTALARFDADAVADLDGLVVATFRFCGLTRTVATHVTIVPATGPNVRTAVFGRESPMQVITGELSGALVRIGTPGDCTGDHAIGTADFGGLQSCFTGPAGPVDPPAYPISPTSCCPAFDFDADGDIDLNDLAAFVQAGE